MLLKFVAVLLVLGLAKASSVAFECEDLLPRRLDVQQQDRRDYPVFTQLSKNTYTPNEKIEVTLAIRGPVDIRFFIAQMRVANSDIIRGTWLINDPIARTHACAHEADTLVNAGSESLTRMSVTWVAPHTASETGNEAVEFKVTIMTEDGQYWTTDRPVILRESEADNNTPKEEEEPANEEDSEEKETNTENADDEGSDAAEHDEESRRRDEDDHGLRVEIEMIKLREEQLAKEIEAEDRASEGDWSITLEEERKQREEEMKKEMYEYERNKAKEEEARMERMRAEIRDKEEWEAAQAKLTTKAPKVPKRTTTTEKPRENPKNDNEIDYNDKEVKSGNGAAMATACVLSMLSALLLTFF